MTETDPDLEQLHNRVAELEQRVSALESAEAAQGGVDGVDRYDARVLTKIGAMDSEPSARQITRFYKDAGVRDIEKIKDRHKHLKTTGRIQDALED
jgi:hypothetical protein